MALNILKKTNSKTEIIKKNRQPGLGNKDEYLIGIDYGTTNIGLALGKNGLVMPIKSISGKNTRAAIDEINRTAIENKVVKFVVGLPLNAGDKDTPQSMVVRKFVKLLKVHSKRQVFFQNEYGTTNDLINTNDTLAESYIPSKSPSDHFAAALILKKYYDSLQK